MKVKIFKVEGDKKVDAAIEEKTGYKLPSLKEGWRFNFNKNSRGKGACTYVLITEETPGTIEGCLIYKLNEVVGIYMAYIEIAPHNRGDNRKYKLVAECLIAYAALLSYTLVEGANKGWLTFDVIEEDLADQSRLMRMYSSKYGAVRIQGETIMYIKPEDTQRLIELYLTL